MGGPDAPTPEAQNAEIEDNVLSKADDLLARYSRQETRQTNRDQIIINIKNFLTGIDAKINKEEGKTADQRDYEKLARLRERKNKLTTMQEEILAKPDERADKKIQEVKTEAEAHGTELQVRVERMKVLTDKIAELKTKLPTLQVLADAEGATPEARANLVTAYDEIATAQKELKGLEKEGTYEQQEASRKQSLALAKKAQEMMAAEHEQEAAIATETLEASLARMTTAESATEAQPTTPPAKPSEPATTTTDAAADQTPGAGKEVKMSKDFNEKMGGIAKGLATSLGDNPPRKDDMVGKVMFQGKAILFRIMMAFSKNHEWVKDLTDQQKTNLQGTTGLTFNPEDKDEKGNIIITWNKPTEGYEAVDPRVVSIFEKAYGALGWKDGFGQFNEASTFEDLQKKVAAAPAAVANASKTGDQKLMDAVTTVMTEKGIAAEDQPKTPLIQFMTDNAADVKKAMESAAAPVAEAEAPAQAPVTAVEAQVTPPVVVEAPPPVGNAPVIEPVAEPAAVKTDVKAEPLKTPPTLPSQGNPRVSVPAQ